MSLDLTLQNRQRTRLVETRHLRRICTILLKDLLAIKYAELGVTLVAAPEMARINEQFLHHKGSTDVITFDYSEIPDPRLKTQDPRLKLHGELFVCLDEAVLQARRFRTTWQSELGRYIIHGTLHLLGHDDHHGLDRRAMKREENRLLQLINARFPLSRLARKPKLRA
jgi:probable rRNA maturation factor